jgi:hypothetical protein
MDLKFTLAPGASKKTTFVLKLFEFNDVSAFEFGLGEDHDSKQSAVNSEQ